MALGLLAHDQGIQRPAGQGRRLGDATHQGIGPQGESRHRHRLGLHQVQHPGRQQGQPFAAKAHWFAVHVVVAAAARGQGEAAMAIGPFGQQIEQALALFRGGAGKGGRHGCLWWLAF